jgi:cation diffusion facilitator family transporter
MEFHSHIDTTGEKKKVALISVLASVSLTLFKLIVGIITGSLGIISEAAHSGLDLGATIVTYFAVRVSDKPADKEHHYGHGKVENFSALIEAFLLLVVCIWIVYEAVQRIFFKSIEIEIRWYSFGVMIFSIAVDFWRYRALHRTAKKYQSQALEADALHFSSDIYSSLVVILGLILANFGIFLADPLAALGVSIVVLVATYRLTKRAIDVLLDKAPDGVEKKIFTIIEEIVGRGSVSRLRVRRSGAKIFVDTNVFLDQKQSLEDSHLIAERIEREVSLIYPVSDVVVHAEPKVIERRIDFPKEQEAGLSSQQKMIASILEEHMEKIIGFHNLSLIKEKSSLLVNFHLVLPKDIHIEKAHELCDHLEKDIQEKIKDSEISIHVEPCEGECTECKIECEQREKE